MFAGFFDSDGSVMHWFARLWSWLIMKTIRSPLRVIGLDSIDTSKPQVYAVNHASALDIPVLYVNLPFQFRIAFKKELLSYPVVGWHLKRSGQICIDQQNPSHSISSIRAALKGLKEGMPLVIFPEGRRTPDGEIKPFLRGLSSWRLRRRWTLCRLRWLARTNCCRWTPTTSSAVRWKCEWASRSRR